MDTDDAHAGRPSGGSDEASDGPGKRPGPDPSPDLRVGDAERHAALEALGTHLEAGRLDVDEYGDRSARAAVAVYRADLATLFADLPAPHPPLPRAPGTGPDTTPVAPAVPPEPAPREHHRPSFPLGAVLGTGLVLLMLFALVSLGAGPGAGGVLGLYMVLILVGGAHHRRWYGRGPFDPHSPYRPRGPRRHG